MTKKYFFYDLETTGTDVRVNRPMQIAYAIVEYGQEVSLDDIQMYYVNPEQECDEGAREVHKITDEQARSGISLPELGNLIIDIFNNNEIEAICGANVLNFDIPLLINTMKNFNIDLSFLEKIKIEDPQAWYLADEIHKTKRPVTREDYMRIFARPRPKSVKFNLGFLCHLNGIDLDNAHDAREDILATIKLWNKLKKPETINLEDKPKFWISNGESGYDLNIFLLGKEPVSISIGEIIGMVDQFKNG